MMKAKLGLTDEQAPKIGAINLKYAEQMEPMIKGTEGPLMKMRAARNLEEQKEGELKDREGGCTGRFGDSGETERMITVRKLADFWRLRAASRS
jgi:hypothetical protein